MAASDYTCTKCGHIGAPTGTSGSTAFAASVLLPGLGYALRGHWAKAIGVFVFTPLFASFMYGLVYGGFISQKQANPGLSASAFGWAAGAGLLVWLAAAYAAAQAPDYRLRCSRCHQLGVIPADSPRARALSGAAAG